jgi:hypothetical protein
MSSKGLALASTFYTHTDCHNYNYKYWMARFCSIILVYVWGSMQTRAVRRCTGAEAPAYFAGAQEPELENSSRQNYETLFHISMNVWKWKN